MKIPPDNYPKDRADVPTSGPSITSWFSENEAELLYVEQYVPWAGDNIHIYWSGCNFYFGERGGYAGIQHQNDNLVGGQIFTYNNICSIWDLASDPAEAEVRLDYGIEGLYSGHFGGEGTGLHTSHPMPWRLDQWYAIVIRRWFIPGESVTRMGMFMYSYTDTKWTHYMSASVSGPDIPLSGNTCTGFLERFNGDALGYHGYYGQHFRMSNDGSWQKPYAYQATAGGEPDTWNAMLVGDGEDDGDANIMLIAGGSYGNTESTIRLEPNQFDPKPKPAMFTAAILSVSVVPQVGTEKVIFAWKNDESTPPQLSYAIEIRALPGDELVAFYSEALPQKRSSIFNTAELAPGDYEVTITVTDIFNQASLPAETTFNVAAPVWGSCSLCRRVQAWVLKFVRRLLNQ
ncbi:DUF3472 domain-containing protein [Pseudomonas sp. W2-17]|uniref:DUF3472 domain-containing protein n=1 Tax=Pseudomonas sp. W2-17 TaxID=3058039 RepID=UPI0034E0B268